MIWRGVWSRYSLSTQNLWRGDLSPLGREAVPKKYQPPRSANRKQGAAAQPSGDKSPRHKSSQLRAGLLL